MEHGLRVRYGLCMSDSREEGSEAPVDLDRERVAQGKNGGGLQSPFW